MFDLDFMFNSLIDFNYSIVLIPVLQNEIMIRYDEGECHIVEILLLAFFSAVEANKIIDKFSWFECVDSAGYFEIFSNTEVFAYSYRSVVVPKARVCSRPY